MLEDGMSFNRLVGRYNPYSSEGAPYLVEQNAKIREMNSLIIRNSANLYKKIADPFGANPYGEFGTGLGTATTGPGTGMMGAGMPPETPVETPLAQTPMAETPLAQTPMAETPLAQTPMAETPVAQPVAATPAGAVGPAEPKFKYNRVDISFCKGYYNCPWWDWRLNSDQQIALNMLQTNGDELILQYKAENNTYPRLASEYYLLPTTIVDFTLYNYSDRQMAYLYFHRDPHEINLGDPAYQKYAIKWADAFNKLQTQLQYFNTKMTWDDMKVLCRPDIALFPAYALAKLDPFWGILARIEHDHFNMGGYINITTLVEYKRNKTMTDKRFGYQLPAYQSIFRKANDPPPVYTELPWVPFTNDDYYYAPL